MAIYPTLMLPGPVDIENDVLQEMCTPMVVHYGEEWAGYYNETVDLAKQVMGTQEDLIIYVGSGHAGLDAIIGSVVEDGDRIGVVRNGFFGNRIAELVTLNGGEAVTLDIEWGRAAEPNQVREFLQSHQGIKMLAVVHGETSTGVQNPIEEIGRVVKEFGCLYMVDTVSSIGACQFAMDRMGVDFCVTASQKAIGAPPGLIIIGVSQNGWKAILGRRKKPRGWYLNLAEVKIYMDTQRDYQPYGITMAVNNVRALHLALIKILEEGLDNRVRRHRENALLLREKVRKLGWGILAEEKYALNSVTVIKLPVHIKNTDAIRYIRDNFNIAIVKGLRDDNSIRVGHMNLGARKSAINSLIYAFSDLISHYTV
jgi:alanine-glyoxylate transaminase/serine-glyoxylate transaminase/serine-pyruvate transaminase